MNLLRRVSQCLLVSLTVIFVACSGTPSRPEGPAPARGQDTLTLGQLIVGALRASQVDRNPPQALLFAERALAQEPGRPDLVWLTARLCADVPRCDVEALEARLRKLDPRNAIVWMGPLSRARRQRDPAVEQEVLEALSRVDRFDVYWNSLLWQGAVALSEQSPKPAPKILNGPLTQAINDVAGWLSAVTVPSFADLADACNSKRTMENAVAERCRRIAQVLQQGDTYAAEAVGIGIAQRAVAANSPAIIALSERAAVLSYQHKGAREVVASQVEREKISAELIELMKKLRREQDVSLAVLRWARQPLRPE
jgi:hypothetical protein